MSNSSSSVVYTNRVLAPEMGADHTYDTELTVTVPLDSQTTFGTAASFIAGFDYSFQDGSHELHEMALGVTGFTYSQANHAIDLTVQIQMDKNKKQNQNYKDGSYLSPGSYIDIVTVVSQDNQFPFEFTKVTASQDSNDSATGQSVTFDVGAAPQSSTTAVSGMACFSFEDIYNGNIHNKINNFWINAGDAYDPAFTGDIGTLTDVISAVNTNGGVKFEGTTTAFAALTPSADNSLAFYLAEHQAQESSVTFDSNVLAAYAVIKKLTNNGAGKSDSNAISSFTCTGLTVAPNHLDKKQVDITWPARGGEWSDGASSWDNIVDYLIIAVLDTSTTS